MKKHQSAANNFFKNRKAVTVCQNQEGGYGQQVKSKCMN